MLTIEIEHRLREAHEANAAMLVKILKYMKGQSLVEEAFVKLSKGKAYFAGDNS